MTVVHLNFDDGVRALESIGRGLLPHQPETGPYTEEVRNGILMDTIAYEVIEAVLYSDAVLAVALGNWPLTTGGVGQFMGRLNRIKVRGTELDELEQAQLAKEIGQVVEWLKTLKSPGASEPESPD